MKERGALLAFSLVLLMAPFTGGARGGRRGRGGGRRGPEGPGKDMSLWIDERQVKELSGLSTTVVQAIAEGRVLPYILDPNFERYLPVIPSDVSAVNFTWRAGNKAYTYDFDLLESTNKEVLLDPYLTIKKQGKVPRKAMVFQVHVNCTGNKTGVVPFFIGLRVLDHQGIFIPGTPLRLRLRKECLDNAIVHECDEECANGGRCNQHKMCECPKGYLDRNCRTALCYPQCMNNGTCISPGVCKCPKGYQGPHCEGGICTEKCLNGGKCIQKDTCSCRRGYYGVRCEYTKCNIPCINGRCVGVNRCKCQKGYVGSQCDRMVKRPRGGGRHHRRRYLRSTTVHPEHASSEYSRYRKTF